MRRFLLPLAILATLPASAQIMGELGAYVKGEWNPTATPEFSVVICRWGARDTTLSGKDLILGQVASLEHGSFAMVLQTPDKGRDTVEVRIEGGVQIFGRGRTGRCTQCPRERKYNGDTLVSRGAYNSDICLFTAVFDQIKGYSTLKIVDMQVGGRSVPYMVKFNTQPLLVRNGLKVPIPNKCSLHPAAVSVKTVAAAAPPPPGESIPALAPPTWSGADEAAANREMRALAAASGSPRPRLEGGRCLTGPFYAAKDGTFRACELAVAPPAGGDLSRVTVEGPGFRLAGIDRIRAFAVAVKACGTEAPRVQASAGGAMKDGKILATAKFPDIELVGGGSSVRSAVRAVLVPATNGATYVRLETVPAAGAPAREILTTKADYLPAFLKLLNPQTALKLLVPGR